MTLCQQLNARNSPATKNSVMDHASGMLPELVRNTTAASLFQFWVELDDGHRRLVPVGGVEHETLAFLQPETLVAFAEADVFDAAAACAQN